MREGSLREYSRIRTKTIICLHTTLDAIVISCLHWGMSPETITFPQSFLFLDTIQMGWKYQGEICGQTFAGVQERL